MFGDSSCDRFANNLKSSFGLAACIPIVNGFGAIINVTSKDKTE